MKLLERHQFTNNKAFETYLLEATDTERLQIASDDVIGFRRVAESLPDVMAVLRPDEALIQARMLINAVHQVTSGYEIEEVK